ncbi:hypothetical protein [Vibrio diabolicus]|uniref:hypothetical protein n=1 Tax=Vibrio diabolicus TaxID=50719 RepID=UPI00211A0E07|nr:hypothetical protein [Vibrio diabolicus]MCQ9052535.1 hypothetical protein [Vibrio diabolicus]
MERDKTFELLCMLAGLLAIAFVFYGRANFDAPASTYAQVRIWIEEDLDLSDLEKAQLRIRLKTQFIKQHMDKDIITQASNYELQQPDVNNSQ